MFYILSKAINLLVDPLNLIALLLVLGFVIWPLWKSVGRFFVVSGLLVFFILALTPLPGLAIYYWERSYPSGVLPEKVDGIIALGGSLGQASAPALGYVPINENADRFLNFARLMEAYPNAKALYSGGTGRLDSQHLKEADAAKRLLEELGIETTRVLFETQSRNTFENARNSLEMARPQPGENWVLVTSAYHMPRSVKVFESVGWDVYPYPVDHRVEENDMRIWLPIRITPRFEWMRAVLRENLGIAVYKITGKI